MELESSEDNALAQTPPTGVSIEIESDATLGYASIQNSTGFSASSNWAFGGSSDGQWLAVVGSQHFAVVGNVAHGAWGGIAVGGTVTKCTFGNNIVSGTSAYGSCASTGNVGP